MMILLTMQWLPCCLDAGLSVADGVDCYIQFGSKAVKDLSERNGWSELFEQAGIKLIDPDVVLALGLAQCS